jgi:putative endonuclease
VGRDCWSLVRGREFAQWRCVAGFEKRLVYILRSDRNPERHYTGVTTDIVQGLRLHNAGLNTDTARDRPWSVVVSIEFNTVQSALEFERYLKSGSGRAFAKRHFP